MGKGHALLVATLTAGWIAGGAAACDDTSGSIFADEEADAAFTPPPGSFIADAGSEAGDGSTTCSPAIPDDYKPEWNPPRKVSACSDDEIAAYYAACIDSLGKDGGADICRTWTSDAAHQVCAQCIEPTDNSGPIQWYKSRFYQTLNIAGCIAVQQGKPAPTDCGGAYHASVQCQRDACDGCFSTPGASFNDFRACQSAAKAIGACKSYESAVGAACPGYKDPGSPALECFPKSGEAPKAHFSRVIALTCK